MMASLNIFNCLPAIDRLLKLLSGQDKYLASPDVRSSREDIRAQLVARLEMAAREPPEQIPPPAAEAAATTAPGERAEISPFIAPALASP